MIGRLLTAAFAWTATAATLLALAVVAFAIFRASGDRLAEFSIATHAEFVEPHNR